MLVTVSFELDRGSRVAHNGSTATPTGWLHPLAALAGAACGHQVAQCRWKTYTVTMAAGPTGNGLGARAHESTLGDVRVVGWNGGAIGACGGKSERS